MIEAVRGGVAGFRCFHPDRLDAKAWREAMQEVRRAGECRFLAWTPGLPRAALPGLEGAPFDATFASTGWWDGHTSWLVEEHEALRRIAPPIAVVRSEDGAEPPPWMLPVAAATSAGILLPLADDMDGAAEANRLAGGIAGAGFSGELRLLQRGGSGPTVLLRGDAGDMRRAGRALAILINTDPRRSFPVTDWTGVLPASAGGAFTVSGHADDREASLAPGEMRLLAAEAATPVASRPAPARPGARKAAARPRVVIEGITPTVDAGRFPAKGTVGQAITVEADIFADGHERLAAALLWRPADADDWQSVPMRPLGNDRWRAELPLARLGRHLFTVEAWWDEFSSFHHELAAKLKAGRDVRLEIAEGRLLVEAAVAHAKGDVARRLTDTLATMDRQPSADGADILLADDTVEAMAAAGLRPFLVRHDPPLAIEADRPQAAFAAWYEMFPRSATDDPARHGTFADVVDRLPAIRAMGFDVLYFPPIHPIGSANRKGRNNTLTPGPDDVGSPYAIGSPDGGHDAIHPQLGTLEDFRSLVAAAADQGLEIALDFAIQCSPDHPWLKDHPGWFRWRPDGSLRYAENPPKKYEDIVNVDFYAADAVPALWIALRDVVLFWAGEGVRTFRVDNPHTKPLPFWEWLIADVRTRHPDALFLAEAFTRPRMMNRLAKIGFNQSYTYFTWRNTKRELTEYLTELTTTEAKDFFRPHFFVNTPDINPVFLQTSGRPGFLIRAALAATLSGLWGVYSGFEICEAAPLPGREEYLDSEKYEIRVRDPATPGNIVGEITRLNHIRRAHPALQDHRHLRFYNAFDDRVILYGKQVAPGAEMILVAVNLDPHAAVECGYELPLWEWGLPDHGSLAVHDLMTDRPSLLTGKRQRIRLDPAERPFTIWRIAPPEGANP
ncbi:starch synthase (maltosyl-transferring) [Stella humosa]|uniref:Alpha-1,4-glucan:maltose-1-phosphate maltosyltransferase n=1 Tax=Stella humosa TaxID=94 RepID=A0A3N1MBR6_9PROT|nr:alpha-1,4-glucan--maltose-1-phosphate maltosyltransferase [Stella humosa]ROQ01058.1 starch synthase (maltosyl-transferring) [Stella humosa]